MKTIFTLSKSLLKKTKLALKLSLVLQITTLCAQQSNFSTVPATDRIGSNKARVLFFNDDQSNHTNENLYVSYGKHSNWWNNVKLEVQKEGVVGTRWGMFADWSSLYLVGNWDNNGTNEDIIFGFGSNLRSKVKEKMRLTDDGKLGIGISNPAAQLHVSGGNIRIDGHELRLEHSSNLLLWGGDIIDNGPMRFKADFDGSGESGTSYLFYNENKEDIYVKFDATNQENLIKGETEIRGDLNISGSTLLKGDLMLSNQDRPQGITITKGLDFNISNIENSHFAIKNAFGADALFIDTKGNIGIGGINAELSEQLQINGRVKASGFIADASSFPDYVFAKDYNLMPLQEVKSYTSKNYHLPGMPSEKEVVNNGLDLKKVATISVEKIEELYLYTFEQQQLIDEQKEEINELNKSLEVQRQLIINLEKRLEKLEK
ncbi:MAG: hypothetical protein CL613_01230 [Aquimarina sp.]|nr:hypothetical protein [Aquimarina sp.]